MQLYSVFKNLNLAFIVALFFLISGCASVISGKTQTVTFQSTPAGATVSINALPIGVTPITTMIEKKTGQTLTIQKEGYKTYTTPLSTSIEPWFWGNIIIGGLLGSTTDGATGAMHTYAPSQFIVTLEPDGTSKIDAATEINKKDKAREFIILGYHQIISDLSTGSGSYLSSLMRLLEIPKSEETSSVKRIKTISDDFPDISQFADQVLLAYIK